MIKEKENKETTITFRLSVELKNKVETMAKKEQRSTSNYIIYLLDKAVNKK